MIQKSAGDNVQVNVGVKNVGSKYIDISGLVEHKSEGGYIPDATDQHRIEPGKNDTLVALTEIPYGTSPGMYSTTVRLYENNTGQILAEKTKSGAFEVV